MSGEYTVTETLTITKPVAVVGHGATIHFSLKPDRDGFFFQQGQDLVTISGLTISGTGRSAIIGAGVALRVTGCTLTGTWAQGINLQGADIEIAGNSISGAGMGIVLGGPTTKAIIHANTVAGAGIGIQWGYSGDDVVISSNIVSASDAGIQVAASGPDVSGVSIIGNMISHCTTGVTVKPKTGFSARVRDAVVSENTIRDTNLAVRVDADNVRISDNTMIRVGYGVSIEGGEDLVVRGNWVNECSVQGVTVNGANPDIVDNIFWSVGYDGIYFVPGCCSEARLAYNECADVGRDCIRNK